MTHLVETLVSLLQKLCFSFTHIISSSIGLQGLFWSPWKILCYQEGQRPRTASMYESLDDNSQAYKASGVATPHIFATAKKGWGPRLSHSSPGSALDQQRATLAPPSYNQHITHIPRRTGSMNTRRPLHICDSCIIRLTKPICSPKFCCASKKLCPDRPAVAK